MNNGTKRMGDLERIKEHFKKNASCLNVRGVELRAELPPKTLDHYLKGRRSLPEEAKKKIVTVLKEMNFK